MHWQPIAAARKRTEIPPPPIYKLTFNVTPTGAKVELKKNDANGDPITGSDNVFSNLPPENYYYSVSATDYDTKTGTVEITNKDVTQKIDLTLTTYTLTFNVTPSGSEVILKENDANGDPVTGSNNVFSNLAPGNYYYSAGKTNYATKTGTLEITNKDLTQEVTLEAQTLTTYTGENTIGQAVKDAVFGNDDAIFTITNVDNGSVSWSFGAKTAQTKTASNNTLELTKSDLATELNKLANNATATLTIAGKEYTITYKQHEIRAWQDLQAMRLDLGGAYTLKKDVTFPDENNDNKGDYNFSPIGNNTNKFTGSFNGENKTIYNLHIDRETTNDVGLFGFIDAGVTVQNITLKDVSVKGRDRIGGLVGQSGGTITNAAVEGGSVEGVYQVGGLVGYSVGTVRGYTKVTVSGVVGSDNSRIGGLVGTATQTVIGYATGNVTGLTSVGGLVGSLAFTGTVTGYATGNVSSEGDNNGTTGGLVGVGLGTITGYARGNVTRGSGSTETYFGLLVGSKSTNPIKGYHSGKTGESELIGIDDADRHSNSVNGVSVTVTGSTERSAFEATDNVFSFGTAVGQWTWVADGKWPAINLGFGEASDQPINP